MKTGIDSANEDVPRRSVLSIRHRSALSKWFASFAIVTCISGCVSTSPYRYGRFHSSQPDKRDVQPIVFEYGKPHKTLDRIANILAAPAKLLRLSSKVDNHHVSDETLAKLVTYLEKNDLTDVYVDVNHYAPREQWRRLRENRQIAPIWKYTSGALSCVGYTLFPGRLFGGTTYNPFTNSMYVNSDVPAMLLFEAAYAKDIHGRSYPGFYTAVVNGIPGFTVWRHVRAVEDVLSYSRSESDWPVEKETYSVVYAHIGAEAVGGLAVVFTGAMSSGVDFFIGPALGCVGAAVGHTVGHIASRRREAELEQTNPKLLRSNIDKFEHQITAEVTYEGQ